MEAVQLIKPGEGRKYRLPSGRTVEPGTEFWRTAGDAGGAYRTVEIRGPLPCTIVITPTEVTLKNRPHTTRHLIRVRGTKFYDAQVLQINLAEAKIFRNIGWCKFQAGQYYFWVKRGKPKLNTRKMAAMQIYLNYSPMTRVIA